MNSRTTVTGWTDKLTDTSSLYKPFMKKHLFILLIYIGLSLQVYPCTSLIITGKNTPDGRPLMWKHRDTEQKANHIVFVRGERYDFIGLPDSNGQGDIWIGTNAAGFSLMNTASFNLKDDDVDQMDKEGVVMRRALSICRNAKDFENYLDTLSRPMRVEANFGVIDAEGGAAYYETNNHSYVKRDANNAELAPEGYLACTNFSFSGRADEGYGYIRYASIKNIVQSWGKSDFTPDRLFWEGSNSFYNAQLGIRLYDSERLPGLAPNGWAVEQDFISRKESLASVVIHGVKKGENPEMVTMWTELGYPPMAFAIPLWVKMGVNQPKDVTYDERFKTAPLCHWANALRDRIYSIRRGSGQKYLHWEMMWRNDGMGYLQQLKPVWHNVYELFVSQEQRWRRNGLSTSEVTGLYEKASEIIHPFYKGLLSQPFGGQ